MKKLLMTIVAIVFATSATFAERYVMVTHGEGKDPFWPVVQKVVRMQLVQSVLILNTFTTLLLIWLIWQAQFKLLQLLNRMVW